MSFMGYFQLERIKLNENNYVDQQTKKKIPGLIIRDLIV